MSLKYDPASEPLHISMKPLAISASVTDAYGNFLVNKP